jgi:hypothetical protein
MRSLVFVQVSKLGNSERVSAMFRPPLHPVMKRFVLGILLGWLAALATGVVLSGHGFVLEAAARGGRDRIVIKREGYDYAPAILFDEGNYRLYWCAGIAGDHVVHSMAADLLGPWRAADGIGAFDVSLKPTGSSKDFDGLHTCDPSVIKHKGVYYLYYGAASSEGALTAVGVARSTDGVRFERLNGGRPILRAARTNADYERKNLTYGAGQPAVLFREPFFYLTITDSTAAGANPGNGAGQFLLRSRDPAFQTDLQELTATGWRDRQAGVHTGEFSFVESFGMDWLYDSQSGRVVAATNRIAGQTTLLFLDERFRLAGHVDVPVSWREGPALLANADKTALRRRSCSEIPVTIAAATGPTANPWSWDLAITRTTVVTALGCPY